MTRGPRSRSSDRPASADRTPRASAHRLRSVADVAVKKSPLLPPHSSHQAPSAHTTASPTGAPSKWRPSDRRRSRPSGRAGPLLDCLRWSTLTAVAAGECPESIVAAATLTAPQPDDASAVSRSVRVAVGNGCSIHRSRYDVSPYCSRTRLAPATIARANAASGTLAASLSSPIASGA